MSGSSHLPWFGSSERYLVGGTSCDVVGEWVEMDGWMGGERVGRWYENFDLKTFPPNVKIESVSHHIREVKVCGLSEGFIVLLSHSGQVSGWFLKLDRGHFFQHRFQFIIQQSVYNTTICIPSCSLNC
jgi:hypothetical protein